jgi:hypothetical protein
MLLLNFDNDLNIRIDTFDSEFVKLQVVFSKYLYCKKIHYVKLPQELPPKI